MRLAEPLRRLTAPAAIAILALAGSAHAQDVSRKLTNRTDPDPAAQRVVVRQGVPRALSGGSEPAGWQVPAQILRSVPTTAGDSFGTVSAMNREGTVLVVGAPNSKLGNANGVGAIHIFERNDGGTWTHVARIFCPLIIFPGDEGTQPASFAQFGASVAVSGTTVVVGAWGYSGLAGPSFGGRAFVYTRDAEGQWGVLGAEDEIRPNKMLVSNDITAIDLFGYAVGVHVDASGSGWIAVGSSLQGATDNGAIYIFEGSGGTWTQRAKISPSALAPRDNFGSKIALGDRTLVAGVQNADTEDGGVNAGLAYVFRRGNEAVGSGTWSSEPIAALEVDAASANPGDAFGCAVAASADGSTIVVGATGVDNAPDGTVKSGNGAAFVFRATDKARTNWTSVAALHPRESNANNAFGFSCDVSTNGEHVVVGAPGYDASAINSGCAFAFRADGASYVIESADLWATSGLLNQAIGRSVTISGDGQRATAGSEYPTADPSSVFAWIYSPAAPPVDPGPGTPPTPDAPGADQVAGGGGSTTGTPSGGSTPTTGLGGGGQTTATPVTPTVYPWGVARNSIVLVNQGARSIGIVPTDGLQRGGDTSFIGMGTYPEGLVPLGVGDINGDRTSDVIFLQPATRKIFMWEREGAEWNSPSPRAIGNAPAGSTFVGIGDLNSDRVDDIAWYVDGQIFVQFISGSTVGNNAAREFPEGNWRFFVSRALLAQGGGGTGGSGGSGSEIVAYDAGRGVALRLTVSSAGQISEPQPVPVPESGWVLAGVGDVNRDGTPDMLWTEGDGGREWRFVIMRADGTSSSIVRWDSQKRGWRLVALVDWDNNGTVDPMVARDGYVIVLLNQWNTQASGFGYITTPAVEYIQQDVPEGYSVLGFGAQ
ncbi:MAG: hypothetical protein FGM37_07245 [Phycisphaerales bacterium]|nr:hypothetical protein [Phycisphaerales bacterium]